MNQSHLANNSVGSTEIIDGSVSLVDMAPNSVNSSTIVDGSIRMQDLNTEVTQYIDLGDQKTLDSAKAYTDQQIGQLENGLGSLRRQALDGVALALAAQVPSLQPHEDGAITFSYGNYAGHSALAMGFAARLDRNVSAFGSLGTTEYGDVGGSLGVRFAW